ncbi:MAG: type I phosphomannose isomerase catalytic subunit [Opitutaceae bacterium]
MPTPPLLRFAPLYQERVWGGRALATALGRTLPSGDRPIGESWELVDRPEAQSLVVGGPWAGQSLRTVLAADPAGMMGPGWAAARPFPILVKWLDCRERLSLQVHPPAAVAGELRGEPKTENWYLAACEPGAHLIVGLRRGVTREAFAAALAAGTLEACVHRFPVAAGDSILVRSGQLHAIDGGNLILEIQQNSDTTYRVYDWGRVGLDGRPRQLHVEESLRSILWDDFEPQPRRAAPGSAVLADAPEFRLRRVVLAPGESLRLAAGEQPRILSGVAGRLEGAGEPLRRGDNVLAPYAGTFALAAPEGATVLVTENFAG